MWLHILYGVMGWGGGGGLKRNERLPLMEIILECDFRCSQTFSYSVYILSVLFFYIVLWYSRWTRADEREWKGLDMNAQNYDTIRDGKSWSFRFAVYWPLGQLDAVKDFSVIFINISPGFRICLIKTYISVKLFCRTGILGLNASTPHGVCIFRTPKNDLFKEVGWTVLLCGNVPLTVSWSYGGSLLRSPEISCNPAESVQFPCSAITIHPLVNRWWSWTEHSPC